MATLPISSVRYLPFYHEFDVKSLVGAYKVLHLFLTLLTLESSTPDSPDVSSPNNMFCYVRSFTIKVSHCHLVRSEITSSGQDVNQKAVRYLDAMEQLDIDAYITLRYLGKSKDRPWDRHVSDISSTLRYGVIPKATVQVAIQATTDRTLTDPVLVDLPEKTLIALFGRGTLNTQAGGDEAMRFYDEDHALFLLLRTNAIATLNSTMQPCSPRIRGGVVKYAKDIRDYVNKHPTTIDSKRRGTFVFSDEIVDNITQQALPHTVRDGSALMLTIGSDIGEAFGNQLGRFFASDGRGPASVIACYNQFAAWEEGRPQPQQHRSAQLSNAGFLPFINVFPWFVKQESDWPGARLLLNQYLNLTNPYILLMYGDVQHYAVTNSPSKFTMKEYKAAVRQYPLGGFSNFVGRPQLNPNGTAIVIPCFHPGRHGYMGESTKDSQEIFKLVSLLAWYTMDKMASSFTSKPGLSRTARCSQVLNTVNHFTAGETPFGKALKTALRQYKTALSSFQAGVLVGKATHSLPRVPKGILAAKQVHTRKGRVAAPTGVSTDSSTGFEVTVKHQTVAGPKNDNVRFSLSWEEEDGTEWVLAPILLPENVEGSDTNDKRFVHFVAGGLDIRNSSGISIGSRKPVASGNTKRETLPSCSIILTMSENPSDLDDFLTHWEDMTEESSAVGIRHIDYDQADPWFPKSFFDASRSQRSVPFSSKSLRDVNGKGPLHNIRNTLSANPGDLFCLLDCSPAAYDLGGGESDMHSLSEFQ